MNKLIENELFVINEKSYSVKSEKVFLSTEPFKKDMCSQILHTGTLSKRLIAGLFCLKSCLSSPYTPLAGITTYGTLETL